MFNIPIQYTVDENNNDTLTNIKIPLDINYSPNNRIYWGINTSNEKVLCYSFHDYKRVYSVVIDNIILKSFVEGKVTFKSIIESKVFVDVTDRILYDFFCIKRYTIPFTIIPKKEWIIMDKLLYPPTSNIDYYLL